MPVLQETDEWLVVGNGAVGMGIARHIHAAGTPVRLLDRSSITATKDLIYHPLGAEPAAPVRWTCPFGLPPSSQVIQRVLVATKAFSVAEALRPLADRLGSESRIYFMQNGIGFLPDGVLPDGVQQFFMINPGFSVNRVGPLEVQQTGYARMMIGDAAGSEVPPKEVRSDIDSLVSAGVDLSWTARIQYHRWKKLAINAVVNPLSVIHQSSNGELAEHSKAREMIERMSHECAAILDSIGQSITTDELIDSISTVLEMTALNRNSMLQDFQEGRLENELDHILLPFIEEARIRSIPCPALEEVHRRTSTLFARESSIDADRPIS